MPLLLVRHADAVQGGGPIDDAARWLSATGRMRAKGSARQLLARGLTVDRMLTSPRVRAVQTAELFAQALGFSAPIEVLPSLCFKVPARIAVRALCALPGTTLAVGHMPSLAEIVQELTSAPHAQPIDTASVLFVDGGRLLWTLTANG